MGLKKGEKIKRLAKIVVVSTRLEELQEITQEDCILEGFPDYTPEQFVFMMQRHYGKKVTPESTVNRIEFEYI